MQAPPNTIPFTGRANEAGTGDTTYRAVNWVWISKGREERLQEAPMRAQINQRHRNVVVVLRTQGGRDGVGVGVGGALAPMETFCTSSFVSFCVHSDEHVWCLHMCAHMC